MDRCWLIFSSGMEKTTSQHVCLNWGELSSLFSLGKERKKSSFYHYVRLAHLHDLQRKIPHLLVNTIEDFMMELAIRFFTVSKRASQRKVFEEGMFLFCSLFATQWTKNLKYDKLLKSYEAPSVFFLLWVANSLTRMKLQVYREYKTEVKIIVDQFWSRVQCIFLWGRGADLCFALEALPEGYTKYSCQQRSIPGFLKDVQRFSTHCGK